MLVVSDTPTMVFLPLSCQLKFFFKGPLKLNLLEDKLPKLQLLAKEVPGPRIKLSDWVTD